MKQLFPIIVGLLITANGFSDSIFPGEKGEALLNKLRTTYAPQRTLSYKNARLQLFTNVDNWNGNVTLCYTGQKYATSTIPPENEVNTEHTWPQSYFERAPGQNMMKCDLHHLYPSESTVNSRRGNSAFGEIPDEKTLFWYRSSIYQIDIPSSSIRAEFSEALNSLFEPREAHKGNAARALFYFYAIYGAQRINHEWFKPQVPTLLSWNEMDPPDTHELERNQRIKAIQGNANPFVLDPSLARRTFDPESNLGLASVESRQPILTEPISTARRIRIAQWNAHEVFDLARVDNRRGDYQKFAEDIRPDIVTINEFTSRDELQRLASYMQIPEAEIAWSDFEQNDNGTYESFEVGVISRFPITSFTEFDLTPDNVTSQGDPQESLLIIPRDVPGLTQATSSRGFLRVQIDDLKLMLYVCHLKSSNGESGARDHKNAQKREAIAACLVQYLQRDVSAYLVTRSWLLAT